MKEVVLGIDIGGTFTKYGLVDKNGFIFNEGSLPTDRHAKVIDFITELKTSVHQSLGDNYNIKGVGIGAPNGNYYTGKIESAPNLRWKGVIDLTDLFEEKFGLPVKVTNDANAAALGEMLYGDAVNMKNFIMITLGTGLGSGIVVNGEIVYGHDGFAGEIGHTIVDPEGRNCACGKRGCLETYVSAPGIKRTVFELLATETKESVLRKYSFDALDSKTISEAANNGDEIALKAFEYTGKILGLKLADAVAHTSPEAIFLFGGLSNAGDLIFVPTKKYLDQYLLCIYSGKIKLLPSKLQDKNIAVIGAAALMWKELA
ncbi:MAG: ROK family protein [Bacteroidales bacterium]|nr:ROK family protein [Bacteroidales bacterium]MCF8391264.1 ROK family protein [Bacteroidales bacterium]